MDELTDLLQVLNHLPNSWKIVFLAIFFLLPKLINMVGGTDAVKSASSVMWETVKIVIRNIQARKQMQVEDAALTEAYTRTLVVETLSMFALRLERMDHKVNWLVKRIDSAADIEQVEAQRPVRKNTNTIIHSRQELIKRMTDDKYE